MSIRLTRLVAAVVLVSTPATLAAQEISLEEAWAQARNRADYGQELQFNLEKIAAGASQLDQVYAPVLYGSTMIMQDRSEQTSTFNGDRTNRYSFEVGARKLFATGTYLDANVSYNWNKVFYPPQPAPQPTVVEVDLGQYGTTAVTLPPTQSLGSSSFVAHNPAHQTKVSLTLSQSLTKNLLGRQIRLQRELIEASAPSSELATEMQMQGTLAAVESLYIELQAIDARLVVLQKGIGLIQEMEAIARRKIRQGRAEKTDLLGAISSRKAQEQVIESLLGVRRNLEVQLADLLGLEYGTEVAVSDLTPSGQALPDTQSLVARALGQRADVQLQKQQIKTADIKVDQARVEALPDVSVFAGVNMNGLEGDAGPAWKDLFDDGKHISWQAGLQGEWAFGRHTSLEKKKASAEADRRIARLQIQRVEREVRKQIAEAAQQYRNASNMLQVLDQRIQSLRSLLAEEQRLYAISRSDAALVLGRRQELIGVENDRIDAVVAQRKAEATVRMATHAYQTQ